jgi:hypothetical protein
VLGGPHATSRGRRGGWLALGTGLLAVLVGALVYVSGVVTFYVQTDELAYIRNGIAIGDDGALLRPGDFWFSSYAQLLPLLIAPLYGALPNTQAFDAAHALQAVLFVSTAIPVFLLCRRLTGSAAAGVVAGLVVVLVPWLAMTATVLTEPLAYATFAWALLAMQHALEVRTWRGDLVALLAVAVAFFARTQFAVLGPLLVVAVLVHGFGFALTQGRPTARSLRRAAGELVRAHPLVLGVAAVAGLALLTGVLDRSVLGAYATTVDRSWLPGGTFDQAAGLTGVVAVAVGLLPLPLALAAVVLHLVRPGTRELHAFASLAAVVGGGMAVVAGSFVVGFAFGESDRYLMYLAPILVVGAAVLLLDPRPAVGALLAGGAGAAYLVAQASIAEYPLSMPSPARTTHAVFDGRVQQLGSPLGFADLPAPDAFAAACVVFALALAVVRARRRWTRAVPALVAAFLLVAGLAQTAYTLNRFDGTQSDPSPELTAFLDGRSWVDARLGHAPGGATGLVGIVFDDGDAARAVWWETMTFNSSVDRFYFREGDREFSQGSFARTFTIAGDGRLEGVESRPHAVVAAGEPRFGLRGAREVAAWNGLVLLAVDEPLRAAWAFDDLDEQGTLVDGDLQRLAVFGDGRERTRRVDVTVAAPAAPAPVRVRVGEGRPVTVAPGESVVASGRVRVPAAGRAAVVVQVRGEGARVTAVGLP